MNISDLKVVSASKAGADMDLLNPFDGEKTGVVIRVMGFDAPEMIKAMRDYDRDLAGSGKTLDADESVRTRKAHMTAAAITGWQNFEWNGEDLPYSQEKALEICIDPEYQWIAEQVVRFGGSRRNFTPKPKSDASSGRGT